MTETVTQLGLALTDDRDLSPPASLQERFERFHANHPEVYDALVRLARQARNRGVTRYGIAGLFEVLRWHYAVGNLASDGSVKLNNNYRSRYARLIEEQEADLEGFFETRTLHTE